MNYKQKYEQYKAEVDAEMGHELGWWGKKKANKNPNNFTEARKKAIWNAMSKHGDLDDLYHPDNAIGVTGTGNTATVYYRRNSGTTGHITTKHDINANVGREPAIKDPSYTFGNTGPGGVLVEQSSTMHHQSRNPLVFKADIHDAPTQQRIQTAHTQFTNVKDHEAIKREVAAKYGKK